VLKNLYNDGKDTETWLDLYHNSKVVGKIQLKAQFRPVVKPEKTDPKVSGQVSLRISHACLTRDTEELSMMSPFAEVTYQG
jgi:hypothetical protein